MISRSRSFIRATECSTPELRATLQPDVQPTIHFRLQRFAVVAGTTPATFTLRLEGMLSLAGVERPNTLDLQVLANVDSLRLTGRRVLTMSDFGILPPVFRILLKTADEVAVCFDLRVRELNSPGVGVGGRGDPSHTAPARYECRVSEVNACIHSVLVIR